MNAFGCLFAKSAHIASKLLRSSVKPDAISRRRKSDFYNEGTAFRKNKKSSCRNRINTVVYEDFAGFPAESDKKGARNRYVNTWDVAKSGTVWFAEETA